MLYELHCAHYYSQQTAALEAQLAADSTERAAALEARAAAEQTALVTRQKEAKTIRTRHEEHTTALVASLATERAVREKALAKRLAEQRQKVKDKNGTGASAGGALAAEDAAAAAAKVCDICMLMCLAVVLFGDICYVSLRMQQLVVCTCV
jgi:hypothetical protein